jgi:hypothetical protein
MKRYKMEKRCLTCNFVNHEYRVNEFDVMWCKYSITNRLNTRGKIIKNVKHEAIPK